MEVRGFCPACRQWHDCPTRWDRDGTVPRCPVCGTAPTVTETHSSAVMRSGLRQAEGYCARCDWWFACDTWFELDQPLPPCPHCGVTPSRLNYETAHGWRTLPPDDGSSGTGPAETHDVEDPGPF